MSARIWIRIHEKKDKKQGLDLSEMINERTAKKWEWFSTYVEVEACTSHPPVFLRLNIYVGHQTYDDFFPLKS